MAKATTKLNQTKKPETLGAVTEKTNLCRRYYLERTQINELQAILKEGLYADVDAALVVGELVVFDIDGKLYGVKKSPTTKPQVSMAMLKEKKVLTKWKDLESKQRLLAKEMAVIQDEMSVLEKGCTIPVETGYAIKTLENPKVE